MEQSLPLSDLINYYAQDKKTFEQMMDAFDATPRVDVKSELNWIRFCMEQSHPSSSAIKKTIRAVKAIKQTTPVVLLEKYSLQIALNKIFDLPDTELRNVFIVCITLFRFADTERRLTECRFGCQHSWHNLEDDANGSVLIKLSALNIFSILILSAALTGIVLSYFMESVAIGKLVVMKMALYAICLLLSDLIIQIIFKNRKDVNIIGIVLILAAVTLFCIQNVISI